MDALAPLISSNTLNYHYGKHLQTYINNLNNLKDNTPFQDQPLESIIEVADGALFNNAAQTFNHIFYFNTFSPDGKREPDGKLRKAIDDMWGSFESFKQEFSDAAVSIFGSGWMWLQCDSSGKLSLLKASNAGCPLTESMIPLLAIDVWEHSYYLDYQNRRADYVNAVWQILDWNIIEERYPL